MTSGVEMMVRMKAPVGWAGQSAMGQVQFSTRFCSIRVVRYSLQQDWEGGRERPFKKKTVCPLDSGFLPSSLLRLEPPQNWPQAF